MLITMNYEHEFNKHILEYHLSWLKLMRKDNNLFSLQLTILVKRMVLIIIVILQHNVNH